MDAGERRAHARPSLTEMAEFILHHYDISPYAEKIRLAFGLKGLAWASVTVPATLPKPELLPLTGGFRRTPVLQIGADIYCDTLRIATELDRRCPEPPLLPESGAGFDAILATWAERVLMWPTARFVTGMNRDALPEAFFRDRAEMRGHPVPTRDEVAAGLAHEEGQLRLMLGWVEDLVADDRRCAVGRLPRLADLALYQRLWWLRALDGRAAHALDDFPRTRDWMARIAAVGHGERSELSPRDALRIASETEPDDPPGGGAPGHDLAPQGRVRVATEDFARDPVEGELVHATRDTIAIRRDDPEVGRVHVHFPRLGYAVTAA